MRDRTITAEHFAILCDVIERAWHDWPTYPDDDNPFSHTSEYARKGAMRIVDELHLEIVPC